MGSALAMNAPATRAATRARSALRAADMAGSTPATSGSELGAGRGAKMRVSNEMMPQSSPRAQNTSDIPSDAMIKPWCN